MNGLDWAAAVLTAAGAIMGYYRGFVSQLVSIAGLFIAYLVAYTFYKDIAPWIAGFISMPRSETYQQYEFLVKDLHLDTYVYNALAFALLFFGMKIALNIVGRVLNWIALTPGIKTMNQWSGTLLGFAEALLLVVIAVQVMTVIPNDTVQRLLKQSLFAPYILQALPTVTNKLSELWSGKAQINPFTKN